MQMRCSARGELEMNVTDFDGIYKLTYASDFFDHLPPEWEDRVVEMVNAHLIVVNGWIGGITRNGTSYHGRIISVSENVVEVTVTADPRNASENAILMGSNGELTREPQTYQPTLRGIRAGDSFVVSGSVQHGPVKIELHLERIGDLGG